MNSQSLIRPNIFFVHIYCMFTMETFLKKVYFEGGLYILFSSILGRQTVLIPPKESVTLFRMISNYYTQGHKEQVRSLSISNFVFLPFRKTNIYNTHIYSYCTPVIIMRSVFQLQLSILFRSNRVLKPPFNYYYLAFSTWMNLN